MRNASRRAAKTTLLLLGVATLAPPARGQSSDEAKATCDAGVEQAQLSRKDGKLREAREALLKCVQTTCAFVIQQQCAAWLDEVDTLMPSVVVKATADGEDRSDVAISIDGVVVDEPPGKAILLDPGPHNFVFTYAEHPPIKRKLFLNEGEKLLSVVVTFDTPRPVARRVVAPPPPAKRYERPVPAVTYVFTGLAVVGAGAFTYLGLSTQARRDELERDCAPGCPQGDVNSLETRSLAANISLGVGGAALAGALISYLVRPSIEVEGNPVATALVVSPAGATVHAAVTF